MHHTPMLRTATIAALAVAVLATSGCSWFRKNNAYAMPAESRPLEVPPDLDRPTGAAATTDAPPAAVSRSQVGVPGMLALLVLLLVRTIRRSRRQARELAELRAARSLDAVE